ncbi:MAG: VTT domain-containing protein [Roseitalea porphyridii]|uniref:TVP38/TMEM64 family protein n=2 Tax=Roseitalea porphyridii TaxID=1852022 RepID=UPI0032EB59EE
MTKDAEMPRNGGLAAKARRFAPLIVIAAGLTFAYLMGWQRFFTLEFLAESRDSLTAFVDANFWLSTLGFTALYAVAVAFSFPAASILTIFAGFLFGWLTATVVVAVGATAGATAIFMVARSAFGESLRDRVGRGRVKKLAEGFEEDAFSYLLVLRIAPIFPFFIMNVAPALFNVPVRTYVIATFFGILPGVIAYSWLGQGIGSVLDAAEAAGTSATVGDLITTEITLAFVALAIVAAVPVAIKKWRRRNTAPES